MALRIAPLELATVDALAVDAWAVFVGEDERPPRGLAGLLDWRLCGALSRLLQDRVFRGFPEESLLTPAAGAVPAKRIFAFGLGRLEDCDEKVFRAAAVRAAQALDRAGVASAGIGLPEHPAGLRSARILAPLLKPLPCEFTLLGDMGELSQAIKPAA